MPTRSQLPSLVVLALAFFVGLMPTAVLASPQASQADTELWLATFDEAWSLIDKTHFDPEFNGVDWAAVRDELRPKVAEANSLHTVRAILRDMLSRLGQSHFALLTSEVVEATAVPEEPDFTDAPGTDINTALNEQSETTEAVGDDEAEEEEEEEEEEEIIPGSQGKVGLDVRVVQGEVVVTSVEPGGPADQAGIKTGWVIDELRGRDLNEIVDQLTADLPARVAAYQAAAVANNMLEGDVGRRATLHMRDGDDNTVEIDLRRVLDTRERIAFGNLPPLAVETSDWVERHREARIGVIKFNIWMIPAAKAFDEAIDDLRSSDGIVIDLRGNPGGIAGMAMGIAGHFIDERVSLGALRTRGRDLQFRVNPRRVNPSNERVDPFDGPVAILVDGMSGSTSEVFAGGMQSIGRARIFGEQTMGAALPAMMDKLPTGDVLLHAFADFLDSNGRSMEGDGVIPDQRVELTRRHLLEDRDLVLEAAVQWIATNQHSTSPQTVPPNKVGPAVSDR